MQDCLWSWVITVHVLGRKWDLVFSTWPLRSQYPPHSILEGGGGCARGMCLYNLWLAVCNGKLPLCLCRGNVRKTKSSPAWREPQQTPRASVRRKRAWAGYFQTWVAKTSRVNGFPFDKYTEEIGANYKVHGGKPLPPEGPTHRCPDIPETCGCNCQEWVISVWCLRDGWQTGQSLTLAHLREWLAPTGFNPQE